MTTPDGIVIRGLTLIEPMGWAIAAGHKPIENRIWKPYRNVTHVAIHAGMTYNAEFARQISILGIVPPTRAEFREYCGTIIAVARLDGYVEDHAAARRAVGISGARWFSGPIGWLLRDVIATPKIPHRGMQRLWALHPAADQACREVLAEAAC